MARRELATGAATALLVAVVGTGAAVAAEDPVADLLAEGGYQLADLVQGTNPVPEGRGVMTYSAVLTFQPGSKTPKVSGVRVTTRPVDFDGAASGPDRAVTAASISPGPAGKQAAVDCAWQGGKRHGVTTFDPQRVGVDTEIGALNLATAFARAARTADVVGQPAAAQWVGCAAGGATLNKGLRLLEAGAGVAYRDASSNSRFGTAWKYFEEAPASYELRSGFPVAYDKTGAMVGTVRQVTGGELLGSFSSAVDTPASDFDRNGSHGYWQDPCIDSPACPGSEGSRGFHGATAHAVWALPGEVARSFVVTGYVHYACAVPNAPACT